MSNQQFTYFHLKKDDSSNSVSYLRGFVGENRAVLAPTKFNAYFTVTDIEQNLIEQGTPTSSCCP